MLESQNSKESQVTNISQADAQTVQADLVRMNQASAGMISANEIELEQSAAANVKAGNLSTNQSALASVEAEEVLSQNSAIGYVQAEKASLRGYIGAVGAGSADVQYSLVGLVVGRDVHAENTRTVLLVGRNVTGNVTTLVDNRSALIAGLTAGLFGGLMLLLGQVLFGRK